MAGTSAIWCATCPRAIIAVSPVTNRTAAAVITDYWVYARHAKLHHAKLHHAKLHHAKLHHAKLHQVGDVTLVLSKKRRNDGPKQSKIIVTNLPTDKATTAGTILSGYARRWDAGILR